MKTKFHLKLSRGFWSQISSETLKHRTSNTLGCQEITIKEKAQVNGNIEETIVDEISGRFTSELAELDINS